ALAEFVDNSLQAMHNVHPPGADETNGQGSTATRLIEIKVFFDEHSIVIADNGEGMDQQKLKEYATFALGQDMRGTAGKEFISKFGVGAKQAGFYIGDRIAIKTRKRNEPILEFVIDERRLEQRSQEKGAVFRDSIVVRGEPDREAAPAEGLSSMEEYITRHQRENSHFTVIILRMRPHIETSMRRSPDITVSLSKDLADIYHFHLHPNDLPNALVRSERFHDLYVGVTGSKGNKKKRSSSGTVKETTALTSEFTHPTHYQSAAMTGAVANLSLVEGVLFYYPTKAGKYTKPNTQTDENIKPDMIDIYWQDRLVPETKLTMLPFMPECKTPLQCEKNLVPVDWRDRLHGFLFFGWDFRHISNNKLKFQVD
ncbi:unnamed protein product, partial [Ectocarpus fasciculatus]